MLVDKISKNIACGINTSSKAQKMLEKVSNNPAMAGAVSSFVLATTLRPLAVMAVTKDRDDAKYAVCSSISAALVEVVGACLLFKPMNKAIENSSRQLYKMKDSLYYRNPELLRRYKSITNRVAKLPLNFINSMARFSMVYPISLMLGALGIVKSTQRHEKNKMDVKA